MSEIKANISEKLRKLILSITSVPFIYIDFRKAERIFFPAMNFARFFAQQGALFDVNVS